MYFVQEDTALYVGGAEGVLNAGGTLGLPPRHMTPNATYYFLITYYEGDQQAQYVVSRPADLMANYTHVENGQLYLNEGAPRLGNLQDFAQKNKDDNADRHGL